MSFDNISKGLQEHETHDAFHKVQKSQEPQKKVTVKYPAEKQNTTSQENDCTKLRRSYRSPVKPRRFEPEEIKTGRSKIFRECFGSDSEGDGVAFAKKDNPARNGKISRKDNGMKSKKKKRKSWKLGSPEKKENRRMNTINMENQYTKSKTKSPHLKNEPKRKSFVESELRRSNRTPVKPRRFEPDINKSTQKIYKRRVGDKAKRDSLSVGKNCEVATGQSKINLKKEVFLKLEEKESKRNISKYVYPSSEEIAEMKRRENEQMRTNREMKAILKGLIQVPEKVKILSLNSMTTDQILDTFPKYKPKLDVIFRELCSEPKVTGYNGINHFSVIELIDDVKQLKMMHKLGEVYETDHDGVSMYPMLFANALMPGWLVYILKDKYNLTFSEAVTHLDKQRQYMQYLAVEDNH